MELAMGGLILASAVQLAVAVVLWTEVRGYRVLNRALAELVIQIEDAEKRKAAGIFAAIADRAMADEKSDGTRAH
jgi:hypothetical protein